MLFFLLAAVTAVSAGSGSTNQPPPIDVPPPAPETTILPPVHPETPFPVPPPQAPFPPPSVPQPSSTSTSGPFPDPGSIYINGITYGGSGCPQGTLASAFSDDKTTFTLIYDQFVASSGPGTTITDQRKNCQINIDMHFPQGFQYSVASVTYRGYAQLPFGVSALQKATYYFSGESDQISSQTTFQGPYSNDYLATDRLDIASAVWSPCGASLNANVNAQVRLTGSPSALAQGAQITVDSLDGKVRQEYALQWRQC